MNNKGVLLVNLGSPDSPSVRDVRRYLAEFLMDERVIDLPWLTRFLLVHGIILRFRPKKSAEAYHKIWTPEGSPLVVTCRKVQVQLQQRLGITVELAMRYQNPSIAQALGNLQKQGVTELLVVPLFPHYAMSSYETAVTKVKQVQACVVPEMNLNVLAPYFAEPEYIQALVGSARPYLQKEYDHLLFSFHGLPERHLQKADPTGRHCLQSPKCCETPSQAHRTCYRAQCFQTVSAFVRAAGVSKYSVAFQSRLGRDQWIQPYTDQVLAGLPAKGIKKLLVMSPAFVADCLETLEEIGIRGRETFLQAGGQSFELIPCLNDHPEWVAGLEWLIRRTLRTGGG